MKHRRPSSPQWVTALAKKWGCPGVPEHSKQAVLLKKGIRLLADVEKHLPKGPLALSEQPFDRSLLNASALFYRSRKLYREHGGEFLATLVSSARTLSSPILLDPLIEYSPIASELIWTAQDPIQSKDPSRLLSLRLFCTSLFHEQNHRLLWKFLPLAPRDKSGLRRYLNFVESLVITLDMALGDQLGPSLASLFYLVGVTYDPGTTVKQELPKQRGYRNYLQAALHATYLNLEQYEPKDIHKIIIHLFPFSRSFAERAALRSSHLDLAFIERTNPSWQIKHRKSILEKCCGHAGQPTLQIPADPLDNREQYLVAEKWFDFFGL